MTKIRKLQPGGWTPNYNIIQNDFGKYSWMQNNLIGNFSSLKNAGNFSLNLPPIGIGYGSNHSAALSGSSILGSKILSNSSIDSLNTRFSKIPTKLSFDTPTKSLLTSDFKLDKATFDKNALNQFKAQGPASDVTATTSKGGMSQGLQSGLSSAGSLLGGMSGKNLTDDQKTTREGIRSAIGSAGPIGAIISAASGVVDMIGDVTGLNIDNIDKAAAERAGIKGTGMNNLMNALPGNSMIWGSMVGKTNKAYKSGEIDELSNAYSGTVGDINAAQDLGNKRFFFGKNKANKFVNKSNVQNKLLTDIGLTSALRKSSTYGEELASQNYNRYLGQSGGSKMTVGKLGMKLPALEEARKILKNFQVQIIPIETEVEKFAEGGKMNVIAQGALHSRKNHLEEINDNLVDVTSKGIPVISLEEGGELTQHAEIEGGELVLTKELTTKLEELYKDGSEEAMIEAGKLLSEEIVENTDDKTNEILNDEDND